MKPNTSRNPGLPSPMVSLILIVVLCNLLLFPVLKRKHLISPFSASSCVGCMSLILHETQYNLCYSVGQRPATMGWKNPTPVQCALDSFSSAWPARGLSPCLHWSQEGKYWACTRAGGWRKRWQPLPVAWSWHGHREQWHKCSWKVPGSFTAPHSPALMWLQARAKTKPVSSTGRIQPIVCRLPNTGINSPTKIMEAWTGRT